MSKEKRPHLSHGGCSTTQSGRWSGLSGEAAAKEFSPRGYASNCRAMNSCICGIAASTHWSRRN